MEDKSGKPKILWELPDTWTSESQWFKGRVKIEPEEVSQDYEFRVSFCAISIHGFSYFVVYVPTNPLENRSKQRYFQVLVTALKGNNKKSYVAVDEFEFLQLEDCEIQPIEAKPQIPSSTTPAPTEPPGRKNISNSEKKIWI